MTVFDEFRELAAELLEELAVPVWLGRVVRTYDPDTRTTSSGQQSYAARGVLTPPPGNVTLGERAEGGAQVTAQYALIGSIHGNVSPAVDDSFTIAGRTFRINGVTAIQPDGAAIAWRLALEDS